MRVPLVVQRFLNRSASLYGNKEALICGSTRETYAAFQERANRLGQALRQMGVQPGDRVAYLGMNCHRLVEAFYGVPGIGAVLMPLNVRFSPQDFAFILEDARPRVVMVGQLFQEAALKLLERAPFVEHVIRVEPGEDIPAGWQSYETLIAGAPAAEPDWEALDEDDVAEIFYTSGTTSRPKGVMLTHRNLYLHAFSAIASLGLDDREVQVVGTVPLFHVNGWGSPHFLTAVGARQVIVPRFEPESFCRVVAQERATLALMVPTMLNTLLNYPDRSRFDLSSLRRLVLGGAPAPYALVQRARVELGVECMVGYGLTETTPILSVATLKDTLLDLPQEEKDRRQALTGLPVLGVELRVVKQGADGQPVDVTPDGLDVGEIWARGDSVMKGYWNRPEETAEVMAGGWFHTGDLAVVDAEGYVNIVDRAKDMVISGGENISTVEVEDALYSHPAVLEAAVIGVPDPEWGEVPKAFVVLKEGQQATEEELIEHCRSRLAHFKCPKSVEFVAEPLPKTPTGKVLKRSLKEARST